MWLSNYLNNISYLIPEIFLSLSLVSLLAYGVIYNKISGASKVGQLHNIVNLTILTLIIGFFLCNSIEIIPSLPLGDEVIIGPMQGLQSNILSLQDPYLDNNSNTCGATNEAGILGINSLSLGIKKIILITGSFVLIWSKDVMKKKDENLIDYEFSLLILMSIIGMLLLVSARDLIIMYLAIETISLSLYVLASIRKSGLYSTEAGLKYFILGAVSSGLLLFGTSLIYLLTGLIQFNSLHEYILLSSSINEYHLGPQGGIETNLGIKLGSLFIIVALLFKLAAAPFHVWSPDVYEGSPTIVTSYFAIVPKIAILGLLITLIYGPFIGIFNSTIQPLLLISGILSIAVGSITAINQTKIKRLFAYSAIAHMGWIILGLGVGSWLSIQASLVYIVLYIIMSLNSFGLILYYYRGYGNNYIAELSGLSRKEPVLAASFALGLFSIAGIPPLAGFFSKYYILLSLIDESFIIISVLSVILSVIGTFYYLRIIQWMYFNNSKDYILKDLGDIAMKKVGNVFTSNTIRSTASSVNETSINQQYTGLNGSLILGASLYIIITYLLYPNILLVFTFDLLEYLI